jgi:hypothetical protein
MTTPRLGISEMIESQSNRYVTFNEALAVLDALVNCSVLDKDLTAPPGGESDGDAYIVAAGATGAWAGHDKDIAFYYGGYIYITPTDGFTAYVEDETTYYEHVSGSWQIRTVAIAELDDEAVTYAKMQHVSATDKVLGRKTAGAGDVEEIACTAAGRALLDDADAATQRATLGFTDPILDKASPGNIGTGTPGTVTGSTVTGATVASTSKTTRSVEAGITASTTQTQGQQPLTKDVNEVSTCANANDVVTLPAAEAGRELVIINNGAQTLQVFPASGDAIDGGAADASVTMATGVKQHFVAIDGTDWYRV